MRPIVKSTLYYSLVSLGYASFLTEVVFAKFYFDSGCNGLNSLSQGLFNSKVNASLQATVAGTAAALNVLACVALISPIDNAKQLLYGDVAILSSLQSANSGMQTVWRRLFAFGLLSVMLSYFTIISASNWLGVYDWLKPYAWLNYFAGLFVIASGVVYNILLSGADIVKSTLGFRGINWTMSSALWHLSVRTYLIALSKFVIAMIYKSAVAGFISQAIFSKLLDRPADQQIGGAMGMVCCLMVMFLTRYPSTLSAYLQPYLTEGGRVDPERLHAYLGQAQQLQRQTCQWQILGRALIRGLGWSALLVGLVIHHLNYAYISLLLSVLPFVVLLLGFSFSKSVYTVDYQAAVARQAAMLIAPVADGGAQMGGKSLVMRMVADAINIGSLAATALLASHSMITLFSDAIGVTNAAILAAAISAESIWVSFFYYRDKYYDALQGHCQLATAVTGQIRNNICTVLFSQPESVPLLQELHSYSRN